MKFDRCPVALRATASAIATFRRWRCAPRAPTGPVIWRAVLYASLLLVAGLKAAVAQPPQLVFNKQLRDDAVHAIEQARLSESAHSRIYEVVSRPTIYRRLPTQTVACDPDLHGFLLRYPEVVVNIWQLMGVTKVKVQRTGPVTFDAIDGAGTTSQAELVHATRDMHIYYAEGNYEGTLFPRPVTGSCVLLIRSSCALQGGNPMVTCTMDVFARLDQLGAELVVKTLYPAVAKAVDFNFSESMKFVGQLSQATEANGPGMQRLAGQLDKVQPAVRESFSAHVNVAYQRAVLRKGDPDTSFGASLTPHTPAATPTAQSRATDAADARSAVPSAHWEADEPTARSAFRR